MIVDYLFQNPTALLILIMTLFFLIKQRILNTGLKSDLQYEQTQITYKTYESLSLMELEQSTILVMSYNILANCFTQSEYFPYCKSEYLHFKYRAPRIVTEIEQVNPDILCLQECDSDLFSAYYLPNLQALGYACHYKAATPNRKVINAVCFKKALFEFEDEIIINLNDELTKKDEVFAKSKDATVINLTHVPSQKQIVIANTHLYWNPGFEYVKYGQICKIIKDIEIKYSAYVPIILCADLNSLPNSNVVKYVYGKEPKLNTIKKGDVSKNKKLIADFWEENGNHLNLRSAYDCYKSGEIGNLNDYANGHPDYTVYSEEFIGTLDYVIYSARHFKVTQLLQIPVLSRGFTAEKIPNRVYPSDHFKIAARFKII